MTYRPIFMHPATVFSAFFFSSLPAHPFLELFITSIPTQPWLHYMDMRGISLFLAEACINQ